VLPFPSARQCWPRPPAVVMPASNSLGARVRVFGRVPNPVCRQV
jgi:hypothetical protein